MQRCASRGRPTNPGQESLSVGPQRPRRQPADIEDRRGSSAARAARPGRAPWAHHQQHGGQRLGDEQQRAGSSPDAGGDGRQRRCEHEQAEHHVLGLDGGARRRRLAQRLELGARVDLLPATSCSFISAMKRLGTPATVSRPRAGAAWRPTASGARVMPTYIRRRSSSRRCGVISSSSLRKGSRPSLMPASSTCVTQALAACRVERHHVLLVAALGQADDHRDGLRHLEHASCAG